MSEDIFNELKHRDIKINLKDLLDEVGPEDLQIAMEWSGKEVIENPLIASIVSDILLGSKELTKVVLGISVATRCQPPQVHNTIATGFIMGIALVLELLNKKESPLETTPPQNTSIQ